MGSGQEGGCGSIKHHLGVARRVSDHPIPGMGSPRISGWVVGFGNVTLAGSVRGVGPWESGFGMIFCGEDEAVSSCAGFSARLGFLPEGR